MGLKLAPRDQGVWQRSYLRKVSCKVHNSVILSHRLESCTWVYSQDWKTAVDQRPRYQCRDLPLFEDLSHEIARHNSSRDAHQIRRSSDCVGTSTFWYPKSNQTITEPTCHLGPSLMSRLPQHDPHLAAPSFWRRISAQMQSFEL
jgi:hypothetical protein